MVPPSKDDPTTAAKKDTGSSKEITKFDIMKCYMTLCNFLSLPKRSILEPGTQISNAVDFLTKMFLFVSTVWLLDHFTVEY